MSGEPRLVRIASLKTVRDFRAHVQALGLELPCDDRIIPGNDSPLAQPAGAPPINGKRIGNRFAIHPMEGWDGSPTGGVTEHVLRRWQRFGQSGAKLIFGGEAMAVRPDGRANPNQLVLSEANAPDFFRLRAALVREHEKRHGSSADLVIGFQLTHSGRFCKPNDNNRLEPRVAYRHPILDRRFGVTSDAQVWTDGELDELVGDYVRAARLAAEAGADFVDIKHCHGYLLHELLGAFTRPGKYGGSFENRTRFLRNVVAGIKSARIPVDIAVRLSAIDLIPFRPDPADSAPGKPGRGVPEDFAGLLPYVYGFGVDRQNPLVPDLTESHQFVQLCAGLGVKIVNISAGSPYYNPHVQRPAAYPPSDGYQPPEDPLVGVARLICVARDLKARAPANLLLVGTGYSYLQEYLPHVAQAAVRSGWIDLVGIGRMVLSYPELPADVLGKGTMQPRFICRTFSDCTTAPRKGLISGCYPLDRHFAESPEARKLKERKRV